MSKERIKQIATSVGIGSHIKIVNGVIIHELTFMKKPALIKAIDEFIKQREIFHRELDLLLNHIQTMKKKGILSSDINEQTYAMGIALFNSELVEEIELKRRFVFSIEGANERARKYAKKLKLDPDIFLKILKTRTDGSDLESKLLACLPGMGIAITIWKLFGGINGNGEFGPIKMPDIFKKPAQTIETIFNSL